MPARLEDNEHLDREDYEESLAGLEPVTRARLRKGDWQAHEGGLFHAEWFRPFRDIGDAFVLAPTGEDLVHYGDAYRITIVDPAGGVSPEADYTCILTAAVTPRKQVLVLDVIRERIPVEGIVPRLKDVCERWRPLYVVFEANFLQSAYVRAARQTAGIPTVQAIDPGGQSKLVRATPAILKAEQGGIFVPADDPPWLEDYLTELCAFTGDDKLDAYDDQVDATAYGVLAVDQFYAGGDDDEPAVLGRPRGSR